MGQASNDFSCDLKFISQIEWMAEYKRGSKEDFFYYDELFPLLLKL